MSVYVSCSAHCLSIGLDLGMFRLYGWTGPQKFRSHTLWKV